MFVLFFLMNMHTTWNGPHGRGRIALWLPCQKPAGLTCCVFSCMRETALASPVNI